ncbi:MAG TPA: hypothetical protein VF014_02900 [Casimicrobiaceae bacterium]|nr:hypothetical protein [Casimicrobiaceae bacterium]
MIGEGIELAALGITLDLFVEPRAIERCEPGAEFLQLIGREPRHGLFDVFKLAHKEK